MFERYNINDLFIASIDVTYPDSYDSFIGGYLLISHNYDAGYGYITILVKTENGYIDLNNPKRKITDTISPYNTSYTISYVEPLNRYYTQDGTKKARFNRRKEIKFAKEHYNDVQQNHMNQLEEKNKTL